MADELVLHYQDTKILLGSRSRLNAAIVASAAILVLAIGARILAGASASGELALIVAAISALAVAIRTYGRLRFANAGLFLAGGQIGTIGTLGGRSAVEVSRLDHLQRCTMAVRSSAPYGVLLFIDREGRSLLRLNTAQLLSPQGLEGLSRRSGLPLRGSWSDTYTAAEMATRYPGSVATGIRISAAIVEHRGRTRLITVAVTILFLLAAGIALFARSGH